MNDKWNPRLWLRNWLLRPSHAEAARIHATAQGEPKAVAVGQAVQGRAFSEDQNEQCSTRPVWADAIDALAASDRALSTKIAAVFRIPESA